eukprot:GFYU01001347.1.p1 GENE.GFYU01001347.1~~GFYU01001347.1.p1  ORF type:complete len:303 (-),score=99.28 GFYU01001347.1:177-1085(-)
MQDRLAELGLGGPEPSAQRVDIEEGPGDMGGQTTFMTEFFQEVGTIKASMSVIRRNIKLIEQKYSQALTATSVDQGRKDHDELEKLMDETSASAQDLRTRLKNMDKANKEFVKKNPNSSEAKIRTNMSGTLTRKFVDLMSEYQEVQTKYKNKNRERVERQYKIVKPEASEDEVREVVEGKQNQTIFADQILAGPGRAQAAAAVADIQERHRDIIKLEQSIQELHQLFVDMSILVESQGELLDQIEYTVNQTVAFTSKGVNELIDAKKWQTKARKKMCCLIIICLVILIIFLSSFMGGAFDSA